MLDQEIKIPDLIDLPIHEETTLSQERVDTLCKLVWENCQQDIHDLLENAKLPLDECRDYQLVEPNKRITHFLRGLEENDKIESLSILEMVYILYEIDRRVRKIAGADEWPAYGDPIAPSPQGPFPGNIIDLPVYEWTPGKSKISQEVADEYCPKLYRYFVEEHPELLHAKCEFSRRNLRSGEVTYKFDALVEKYLEPNAELRVDKVSMEFGRRLAFMSSAKAHLQSHLESRMNHDQ